MSFICQLFFAKQPSWMLGKQAWGWGRIQIGLLPRLPSITRDAGFLVRMQITWALLRRLPNQFISLYLLHLFPLPPSAKLTSFFLPHQQSKELTSLGKHTERMLPSYSDITCLFYDCKWAPAINPREKKWIFAWTHYFLPLNQVMPGETGISLAQLLWSQHKWWSLLFNYALLGLGRWLNC